MPNIFRMAPLALFCIIGCENLYAVDRFVGTTGAFSVALSAAQPGDNIIILPNVNGGPSVIDGGHFRDGLTGVTIRSQDLDHPAIIRGGTNGIQLSNATDVTLERLIFEQQTGNGLNIDDGGDFNTPSTGITLRHLTFRDMNASGNNDGIKLSGVTGFLIDNVLVENWGDGGSAVDPVGSHNGLVQNSIFRHTTSGSSGIRPKGAAKTSPSLATVLKCLAAWGGQSKQAGRPAPSFFASSTTTPATKRTASPPRAI